MYNVIINSSFGDCNFRCFGSSDNMCVFQQVCFIIVPLFCLGDEDFMVLVDVFGAGQGEGGA